MSSEFLDWQNQDLYALLGITRMANDEDIRKAFRSRAKDCHPDRFPLGSSERQDADSRFKELTLARDTLLDPKQRADYDRQQDLVQQAYFDAVIYQVPVQTKPPPRNSFGDTLKKVYQQYQEQEEAGQSYFDSPASPDEEDALSDNGKGVPEASRKNAASFYYSQGMRLAARGQFRRALYALNNARMLDPDLEISDSLLSRIRAKAWYSKS